MLEPLLTKKDVARIIGTTPNVVSHMASVGKFPRPSHLGKRAVWPESVVSAWLSVHLTAPDETVLPEDGHLNGGGIIARPLSASCGEVVA